MNNQEKAILKKEMRAGFDILQKLVQNDNVDLIIINELLGCIVNGLITE